MKILSTITLVLFTTTVLALVDEKLPNNQWAYYGKQFYSQLNTATPVNKDHLSQVLNNTHSSIKNEFDQIDYKCQGNCYRYQVLEYSESRRILFGELYRQEDQRGLFVEDVYCKKKFHFREVSDISHMGDEVNIEHTWPQSKFSKRFDKGMQKSDLHHLYPTDSDANNKRANHSFGEVENSRDELNVQGCSDSQLIVGQGRTQFTPPDDHKGNVARSLFYFSTRYQLPIDASEEMILRVWHELDPVDQEEQLRHEIIARYQNVRNPFIDHPELAGRIKDF